MSERQGIRIRTSEKGEKFVAINFSLWPNEKRTSEGSPNVRGYEKSTGVSAAGWTKEHQGTRFISGNVEIPLNTLMQYLGEKTAAGNGNDFVSADYGKDPDDAIPF